MTRSECIEQIKSIKEYLSTGDPIWDKDAIQEPLDMAISALMIQEDDKDEGLDEVIKYLKHRIKKEEYILCSLVTLKQIFEAGNCNECSVKLCTYAPKFGEQVRYNCPHFKVM